MTENFASGIIEQKKKLDNAKISHMISPDFPWGKD